MTYLGNTVSYEYDANGIRTKKINPTGMSTDYYVVDGKAIGEVVKYADGTIAYWLRYLFDESDQIIGYSFWCVGDTAWSEYYFAKNLQGDVIGVYRASDNAQVAFYEYDAWGNILYKYGEMADINPFRYRTYYYDNETWFYYLQSRYYDPAIGRFINADALVSTGQGLLGNNMFAYCLDNPVCKKDVSGATSEAVYEDGSDVDLTDNDKDINGGKMGDSSFGGSSGNKGKLTFKSESALKEHYENHNSQFGNAFNTPQEYVDAANYVIQNGEYVPSQNAYVKFYGMNGGANFAFVGVSQCHSFITTFHLKHVSQILF